MDDTSSSSVSSTPNNTNDSDINIVPTINGKTPSRLVYGLLVLLIVALGCAGYLAYQNYQLKTASPIVNLPPSEDMTIPTPTSEVVTKESPIPTTKPLVIPKDWQSFTTTDDQLKLTVTLSVPPGFNFSFSGSEWILSKFNEEYWSYSSSILLNTWSSSCNKETDKYDDFDKYLLKCCQEKLDNYYDGSSRRAWYAKYLNGSFSCIYPAQDAKEGEIINVEELSMGPSSYLKVTVLTNQNVRVTRTDYLFVENGILHILKPDAGVARSSNSIIAKNIPYIFASLKSSF